MLIDSDIWPKLVSTAYFPLIRCAPKHRFKVFNNHFQECATNEKVHSSKTNVLAKRSF